MWFIFAVLCALSWGGADLFYKKGSDSEDKLSHWKIVVMVGLVMGAHAFTYMAIKGSISIPLIWSVICPSPSCIFYR